MHRSTPGKRERSEMAALLGLCVRCHGPINIENSRYCLNCREYMRMYKANQRDRNRRAGLCVCCGKVTVPGGRSLCKDCLERNKTHNRLRYYQRRDAGLCTTCGKPLPDGYEYKICPVCRDRSLARQWKRMEKQQQKEGDPDARQQF